MEAMDLGVEKSQSSGDDEKEGEDDIVGRMEIDDSGDRQHLKQPDQDMTEVADILLRLQVSAFHWNSQLAHARGIHVCKHERKRRQNGRRAEILTARAATLLNQRRVHCERTVLVTSYHKPCSNVPENSLRHRSPRAGLQSYCKHC